MTRVPFVVSSSCPLDSPGLLRFPESIGRSRPPEQKSTKSTKILPAPGPPGTPSRLSPIRIARRQLVQTRRSLNVRIIATHLPQSQSRAAERLNPPLCLLRLNRSRLNSQRSRIVESACFCCSTAQLYSATVTKKDIDKFDFIFSLSSIHSFFFVFVFLTFSRFDCWSSSGNPIPVSVPDSIFCLWLDIHRRKLPLGLSRSKEESVCVSKRQRGGKRREKKKPTGPLICCGVEIRAPNWKREICPTAVGAERRNAWR